MLSIATPPPPTSAHEVEDPSGGEVREDGGLEALQVAEDLLGPHGGHRDPVHHPRRRHGEPWAKEMK